MTTTIRASHAHSPYREPFWLRLLIIVGLLIGAFQLPSLGLRDVSAAAPCMDYGQPAYTARICITTPAEGSTAQGDVPVTATVTQVSGTLPAVDYVRWYLSKTSSSSTSTLGSDYLSPYTFQVPTYRWTDGSYRLEAIVRFEDGFTTPVSNPARVLLTLSNGVTTTPSSNGTWAPKAGGVTNIVAVGDGAGGLPGATDVGNLAQSLGPSQFLYLGDVYNSGTYTEFYNYYGPTLGPLAGITNPVPGNHESGNNFRGYRDYWNMSATPYYSYDSNGWHFIALDSTTQFGQTAAGSAQYNWLAQDLQANAATSCTVAFFHHPRFGLTSSAGNAYMQDIWSLLATNGVDVVVTGHEHNYQRWQPMDSNGNVVNNGMIQYVVGTGGHEQIPFGPSDTRVASRIARVDGVMQLSLGAGGGSSRFISTGGGTYDETSFNCHDGEGTGTPTPTATPTPSPTPTPTPTSTPTGASSTFIAAADARVQEANATTNYGTSTLLRADGGNDPDVETYLRFNVAGLTGPPTAATLRLFVPTGANTGSNNGPAVYTSADTSWAETGITWSNRPTRTTTPLDDLGVVSAGTWVEYNVSPAVTGNGDYTFVLATNSSDATDFASRETANPAQLVLYGAASTAVATPTPTAMATPTLTATPSPSATPSATTPVSDVSFGISADARVRENFPTVNYGTATLLQADGGKDPDVETYLKVEVTGITAAPAQAKIRLFVRDTTQGGSSDGPSIYLAADSSWTETGIIWDNRPPRSTTPLDDLGAVTAGTWVEYDVTSAITGNGTYTFVLATGSNDATDFASRETATPPQLILQVPTTPAGSPTVAPSPTAPSTPAATPTADVTPTPSTIPTTEPSPTVVAEPTSPPASDVSFGISADARVREDFATVNYGTSTLLQADGGIDPDVETYLKVEVTGTSGPPVQARIRLFVRETTYAGSNDGPSIYLAADSSWTETGITWENRPVRTTTPLDDLGVVTAGTWVEYDVTSAITGNGTYTFVLATGSNDATDFASRETVTPPELILSSSAAPAGARIAAVEATATPTPEMPPTVEPTATPAPTVEPTATSAPTTEPTATSAPTVEPTVPPLPTVEPTATSAPTIEPTATATATVQPTIPPTSEPIGTEPAANDTQIGTVVNTGGQKLHCRVGPSATGKVLTSLNPGDQVVVRGPIENGWVPVVCGGQDGYVSADYLEITTQAVTDPTAEGQSQVAATERLQPESVSVTEATVSPDEAPNGEPVTVTAPTEPAPTDVPTEPVPTPMPVINGWDDDPQVPWWWLTDTDLNTVWSAYLSNADDTAEVGYDLGYIAPIDHLSWQLTWPMQGFVEIQLSNDGVNWYRLTIIDLATKRVDEWHDIPVNSQARFVNFVFSNPNGGTAGSVREIEVWAAPSGYADPIEYLPFVTPTPVPQPTMEPTAIPVEPTPAPPEPVVIPTEEPMVAPPPPAELPPPTEVVEPAPPPDEAPLDLPPAEGAPGGG